MREYRRKTCPKITNSDPLVKDLFRIMHVQKMTAADTAARAGINADTFKDWRTRTNPRLKDFQAALEVLGFELRIRQKRFAFLDNEDTD